MHLTKKNSQKRQNYYRHNKRSQKRSMGGGGHYQTPRLPTEDNVKDLISVDGNSRNLHEKTEEVKELGSGNFGIVQKRCTKRFFGKKCYAVKTLIIKKEVTDEAYKKLLEDLTQEVKIQRELTMNEEDQIGDKNYIAQYISHSITTAANSSKPIVPYLAMSLYDKSLDSLNYKKDKKFFTNNSIKKFIKQLCQGLKYMNNKNISHNDLAPRNVLIAKVGEKYQPRITDFGLAQKIPNGKPTKKIYIFYPTLESAPEIFESGYIYKNSDVYSAAILLSNIIFNYHYFNEKKQDYKWKDLLKQAPFNRYPDPFSISNIIQMYRKIGNKEDELTKFQPYVELIIKDRYLKEDYSNNSIIATIFEDDKFRKAKCFRYENLLRSNMDELCKLFNLEKKKKEIPALNKDVFDYLKEQLFVDDAKSVSIDVPEAEPTHEPLEAVIKRTKPEEEAEAEAEAEAPPRPTKSEKAIKDTENEAVRQEAAAKARERAEERAKLEAEAKAQAAEAEAATKVRERAEEREESRTAAEAAQEEKKTIANLITLMKTKKNNEKISEVYHKLQQKDQKSEINKKKYNKYEKSSTGLLGSKKKRRQLLQNIFTELPNTTRELPELPISTAGGARTNKKKSNKRSSKKSKKNYTINKKRTHKRK